MDAYTLTGKMSVKFPRGAFERTFSIFRGLIKLLRNPITWDEVQDDLFAILLRFRSHNTEVTSDFQKMYIQVNVENEDRNFQKILWRDNPSSPIKTYRLCTVTYGTASASYLATRVLKQLAMDESSNFPKASEVLLHNCYVDDLLFGADTLEESEKLIPELQELCSGGFKLHNWCSNEKSVLEGAIKTEDSKNSCETIDAKLRF
ncbi:hypothetical protein AVEN_221667-1 [Araneus ventricosus]|uniref:Reverse transcriptase domain-containing protein n=1 Tax=Araneus ventricosus TaxID=182803 RepID=A0A4Y2W0V9_ARAVE|nr:hypothetical protein AVEN_221667-1 [Araneus ventricosus]